MTNKKSPILWCFLSFMFMFLSGPKTVNAQWATYGTNIGNTNTGNVGIGTSSPTYKLHVNGTSYFSGASIFNSFLSISTAPSFSDNNKVLTIGTSNRVGTISTTNWDKYAGDDITAIINTYAMTIGTSGSIRFIGFNPTAVTSTTWGGGSAFNWTFSASGTNPVLAFGDGYANLSTGALGLGIVPTQKLDVAGAVKINSGAMPTCTDSMRGTMWFTPGSGTDKDSFVVCAQDNSGVSDWRTLY
jgi:hypothetical protein